MKSIAAHGMDRRSVSFIASGHMFVDFYQSIIPALLPFLLVSKNLSFTAAAGLVLATNIGASVIQPLFGQLVDRFSALWIMPVGLLLAIGGFVSSCLFSDYWLIVVSLIISGIGNAAFHPEGARMMNLVAGSKRELGMSLFSIGGNMGFALGPLMTSLVVLAFGLDNIYWLGLPGVIFAGLFFFSLKRLQRVHDARFGQHTRKAASDEKKDRWGSFTLLTLSIITRSAIFYSLNTFLPIYWSQVLHQHPTTGNIAWTVLMVAGVLGSLAGANLSARVGRRRLVLIALLLLGPVLGLFLVLAPLHIALAYVMLLPLGLVLFAPFSVMVVMGQDFLPHHLGVASGVTLGLAVASGGIAAPLVGTVADHYGVLSALISIAFLPLLALAFALLIPQAKKQVEIVRKTTTTGLLASR